MEPDKETGVHEKLHHEMLAEKLAPFKEKLGPGIVELITADRRNKEGYKIEITDNPYTRGIIHIYETWKGGSRTTRVFDGRYDKPLFNRNPGDIDIVTKNGEGDRAVSIDTIIRADGSVFQETHCTTETASYAPFGGKPLMDGAFFRYAGGGPMTETVIIDKNGEVCRNRFWATMRWTGRHDRYITEAVIEENGIIRAGRGEHGIAAGYLPRMTVVSNPYTEIKK